MSASTFTRVLCLLLVAVVTFAPAAAATSATVSNKVNNQKPIPGSCLMAASTLCANAETDAMRCLRKLAVIGDARVPNACADAIMAGLTMNPRRSKRTERTQRMARLLSEGSACAAGNTCEGTFGGVLHQRCNDARNGCSCTGRTYSVATDRKAKVVVSLSSTNPSGIACSNICCKDANTSGSACCVSFGGSASATSTSVICNDAAHARCVLA